MSSNNDENIVKNSKPTSILQWLFKLPPPDKRRVTFLGALIKYPSRAFTRNLEKDDQYIMYLLFKYNFISAYLLSFLLYLSHRFAITCGIGTINLCVPATENFVENYCWIFGKVFSCIEIFIIYPYIYALLRTNVKMDKHYWAPGQDGLPHSKMNRKEIKGRVDKFQKVMIFLTVIWWMGTVVFGVYWADKMGQHDSEQFLTWLCFLNPYISALSYAFIFCIWFGVIVLKSKLQYLNDDNNRGLSNG